MPTLEAYYEEEFNTATNAKTIKYFDLTTEVEKLVTNADGTTIDYRRNGTVINTDADLNV